MLLKQTILADREDIKEVVEEEQFNFTANVLSELGIPLEEDVFPEEGYKAFTVEHKIKLRKLLQKFDTTIVDDRDGGITIYVDKTLVAEWKKCRFNLRKDPSAVDPSKRLYAEIMIDYWTIFEENNDR